MRTWIPILRMLSKIAGLAALFYAPHALALGEDITIGDFSCSGGAATGQLLVTETSCPASLQLSNVFSFLMCNMEQISSNILGHMYCGMIYELTPAVWALATLAVTIFGISFTIGLVPATGREALLFIIKIAFVSAFATNADLIISYGYAFFVGGMREGVGIALSGLNVTNATNGTDTYAMLDNFLYSIFKMATDAVGQTAPDKRCQNAVFAAVATIAAVFPIFGYLALLLIGRLLLAFYRAVFGYIYAIVGLTFVTVLAPFFVPMFWFKQTRTFFDRWVGHLVSFSLQMVIIFAALTFVIKINPVNMVNNLSDVVMYWEETKETTSFRLPWQGCTFCDFKVVDKVTNADMNFDDPNIVSKGKLQCIDYWPPNVPGSATFDDAKIKTDENGLSPITLTFAFAPKTGTTSDQMNSLVKLAGYGFVSMIVLAVVLMQVLIQVPELAQMMASSLGATYAPQLGGGTAIDGRSARGFVIPNIPGQSLLEDFKAGFDRSMGSSTDFQQTRTAIRDGNRISIGGKTSTGGKTKSDSVMDGLHSMVTGKGRSDAPLYDEKNAPGLDKEALSKKNDSSGIGGAWRRFIGGGFLDSN